ncbi:MAG: Ig-like domain-containing protein [Deltaproteobacteria bacterium]|nr:Ig-like domain-containing protein [Deltaproteobacteria bacterium]
MKRRTSAFGAVVSAVLLGVGCNVALDQPAGSAGDGGEAGGEDVAGGDAVEKDGGRPYANPCDEYTAKFLGCVEGICAGRSCSMCDVLNEAIADYRKNGYRGSCTGEDLAQATADLAGFSCETDENVANFGTSVESSCGGTDGCMEAGDPCVGGRCFDIGQQQLWCLAECIEPGERCDQGYCYLMDAGGGAFYCAPEGTKWTGESCGAGNDCAEGGACLDAGYGLNCWQVCDDFNPCPEGSWCEDTGLEMKVCVAEEVCGRSGEDCAGMPCCDGLFCNGSGTCEADETCAGERDSCRTKPCCGGLTCDPSRICRRNGQCLPVGGECAADEECCAPADPLAGVWCGTEGLCEICAQAAGACASDYDCCPPFYDTNPLMCGSGGTCVPICETDADCTAPEVCMPNGECLPPACSADADCGGQKCCSGECMAQCGYGNPTACVITPSGGAILKGTTAKLAAIAYAGDPKLGGQVVPWTSFTWSTSDASKVAVDAVTGEITGGAVYGTADIQAKAGSLDCGTAGFTNYLPADPSKVRVLVYDASTGRPVEDASVVLGSGATARTDAAGMVEFSAVPGDVHVFHRAYSYLSVTGVMGTDLALHVTPLADPAMAGGFRGTFDFSGEKYDAMQVGCASTSLSTGFLDADLYEVLFGEQISTHVVMTTQDGAPVDFDDWIMVPGGHVMKATQFGAPDLIPAYRVKGEPGFRAAWGIGGGMPSKDVTKLIQILAPFIGGGEMPMGQTVAAWLTMAPTLGHGVRSALDVVSIPKIPTPENDLGQPLVDSPTMADYDRFPRLDLRPETRMALKTVLALPDLPVLQGRCLGEVLVIAGVNQPRAGFVPLGMASGYDNPDDPALEGDCVVNAPYDNPGGLADGQMLLRLAPPHDGLETNTYRFAVIAVDPRENEGGPLALSARFESTGRVNPTYDFSTRLFLKIPEGAAYSASVRRITGPSAAIPDAEAYRYRVGNDKGDWYVFAKGPAGITLPAVPPGLDDRAAGAEMMAHAISLAATTLDGLVSTGGKRHLDTLIDAMDGFSRLVCLKRIGPSDPQYAEKCRPSDPSKVDPACNPACELK